MKDKSLSTGNNDMSTQGNMQNRQSRIIKVSSPQRGVGQSDVLELRCEPIPCVRIAFIGLGARGRDAVLRISHIDGVEIVALCDIDLSNVEKANQMLESKGFARIAAYGGSTEAWRKVTALPDVDLIYVATDWESHAAIGIQAMRDGKHVALEVPAAMTMDEIWGLIEASEQTRRHCMQLENCIYDPFELTALNMAQHGLFGDIVHAEAGYMHSLQELRTEHWNSWRLDYNRRHRGDLYPTHGLGPICQAMNMHRGDKMNFLVSVDADPISSVRLLKETTGEDVTDFRNGEHTTTIIKTQRGRTILVEHNVNSPRPYSRMYQLTGTEGFANKYPVQGFTFRNVKTYPEAGSEYGHPTYQFVGQERFDELMAEYKHPILKALEEKARGMDTHGGMDYIMDYRLIKALQHGLPLDMDVYDLAEWCCLIPLTALSLDNESAPVEVPDFTRGAWNKLKTLKFYSQE